MARVLAQFRVLLDPDTDPENVSSQIAAAVEPLGVQFMD